VPIGALPAPPLPPPPTTVTLICVVVAGVVNVPGEVNTVMFEKPPAGKPVIWDDGIELALVNTVPLVAGRVSVVVPATAGASSVMVPDVLPDMTTEDIMLLLLKL
jgi:hypothetical protein